jgi:hypothetical protein
MNHLMVFRKVADHLVYTYGCLPFPDCLLWQGRPRADLGYTFDILYRNLGEGVAGLNADL